MSSQKGEPPVERLPWSKLTPEQVDALEKLRAPFPPEQTDKLPKIPKALQGKNKGRCDVCHGYHEAGSGIVHLDYVGHAYVTERLLEVDPDWSWEPYAHDPDGSPAMERDDSGRPIGMWIKLTVAGKTRPGYGSTAPKSEAVKELIGDAIRNAAMRFGVALDHWKKDTGGADYEDDAPRTSRGRRSSTSSGDGGRPDWVKDLSLPDSRIVAAARRIDNTVTKISDLAGFTEEQRADLVHRLEGSPTQTAVSDRREMTEEERAEAEAVRNEENDLAGAAAAAAESWGQPSWAKGEEGKPDEEGKF